MRGKNGEEKIQKEKEKKEVPGEKFLVVSFFPREWPMTALGPNDRV